LAQILAFICLGIFMFYGYRMLFVANVSEYAKEFTASCLGAVITIMATALLLKSQLENEVIKDQLADIFKEKVDLYRQYIDF
jgi:ABC-type Co2+ transport system permease subunit